MESATTPQETGSLQSKYSLMKERKTKLWRIEIPDHETKSVMGNIEIVKYRKALSSNTDDKSYNLSRHEIFRGDDSMSI